MTRPRLTRRRLLLFIALVALPTWLLVTGAPQRVWSGGTELLLTGYSIYQPGAAPGTNPWTTDYVYLPQFAYVNAMLWLPAWLTTVLTRATTARTFTHVIGYRLTASWGFTGLLAVAYTAGEFFTDDDDVALLVMAAVAFLPLSLYHSAIRGVDLWVGALFIATVLLIRRDRWLLAGLAISLAATKFTGVPAMLVVLAYAWWLGREDGIDLSIGLVIGQIPNIGYFAFHWDDFVYIARHHGAISTYALRISDGNFLLDPVHWLALDHFYVYGPGFALVMLGFLVVAIVVALRAGLLPAVALAYFPMGYLVPAENRHLPMLLLLIVMLFEVTDRRWALLGFAALAIPRGLRILANTTGFDPLGGVSLGWLSLARAGVLFQVLLLVAFLVIYRRSRADPGKTI